MIIMEMFNFSLFHSLLIGSILVLHACFAMLLIVEVLVFLYVLVLSCSVIYLQHKALAYSVIDQISPKRRV